MALEFPEKPLKKVQAEAQAAVQKETESRPVRKQRAVVFEAVLIASLSGFAVLAYLANTVAYFSVDLIITNTIQLFNPPWFFTLMHWISWPGFPPQAFYIPLLTIIVLYILGLRWEAVIVFTAALGELLLNSLIKLLIQRPRPPEDLVQVFQVLNSYSFPSGHVMFYAGFFGILWFLSFTLLKPSWMRTVLLVVFGAFVVLVGVSRIYLGQHWASDVLGAYLLGGLGLAVSIAFYQWGKSRFFVDQPVAPEDKPS